MTESPSLLWVKSTYSNNGGSCVEWAPAHAATNSTVPVRDSKSPGEPVLDIPADAFTAFVTGVKDGTLGTR
ncbi:DUF397 domain-containing protein [Streptomyces uncialis]|uniref:DUF397 domain-containing protein n=1 Tax=Streptomyces uncialis TaxID=1048205 RepID=A0A1Q4VF95_9ACTN|nr:DUF397 domain-containing protein [Streptomyces uncialis]OKH96489.1 hypothetical protein AB852_07960 [Streptomyces uncialis]